MFFSTNSIDARLKNHLPLWLRYYCSRLITVPERTLFRARTSPATKLIPALGGLFRRVTSLGGSSLTGTAAPPENVGRPENIRVDGPIYSAS
jgi:hypothetical protein